MDTVCTHRCATTLTNSSPRGKKVESEWGAGPMGVEGRTRMLELVVYSQYGSEWNVDIFVTLSSSAYRRNRGS